MLAGLSSTAAGSVEGAASVPALGWAVLAIVAIACMALAAVGGAWWDRRRGGREHAGSPADKAGLANDSDDMVSLPCGSSTDTAECHAILERNYRLTFYDPLTGLPNRRLMLDRLEMVVKGSRRTDRYAALMFIDLDNFKLVNDTQGLYQGDHLLRHVAKHLSSVVRESDTLARLGGMSSSC